MINCTHSELGVNMKVQVAKITNDISVSDDMQSYSYLSLLVSLSLATAPQFQTNRNSKGTTQKRYEHSNATAAHCGLKHKTLKVFTDRLYCLTLLRDVELCKYLRENCKWDTFITSGPNTLLHFSQNTKQRFKMSVCTLI